MYKRLEIFCRIRSQVLILAGVFMLIGPVQSATFSVDDSGTVLSQSVLPMRWKQLVPGRGADHSVEADVRIALRLNLTRWLNQPVRLYMALAPATSDTVYARWSTHGRLLPGDIRSGTRTLIFNDVVRSGMLEETIDLALKTDGRTLVAPQALQFYFEVDTP
jgi:hypothetical protein